MKELGPIDVWVNNAMVSVFSPISQMTADEYRRVTDVTYLGYVWGTLAALRHMKARGRGVIVQVGSALGHRSIPLQSAYCAAKHAIVGFTESLRTELLHDESPISVVMVEMPALNTPQFDWSRSKMPRRAKPVPPIYQPEVGADAIVFAAEHPERRSVWLGVSTAEAIVGNRIAPGLLDRFLAKTAFESQQTDERERHRGDNLFVPPRGDPGAHGRFDRKARTRAPELALAKHRGAALAVMAGMALVVGTLVVIRGVGS
jgi:short-subunit dehydrogenase